MSGWYLTQISRIANKTKVAGKITVLKRFSRLGGFSVGFMRSREATQKFWKHCLKSFKKRNIGRGFLDQMSNAPYQCLGETTDREFLISPAIVRPTTDDMWQRPSAFPKGKLPRPGDLATVRIRKSS